MASAMMGPSRSSRPDECYRCWQVGRYGVRASCVVTYNKGSPNEWTSPSCETCVAEDVSRFPDSVRVVLRMLQGGSP